MAEAAASSLGHELDVSSGYDVNLNMVASRFTKLSDEAVYFERKRLFGVRYATSHVSFKAVWVNPFWAFTGADPAAQAVQVQEALKAALRASPHSAAMPHWPSPPARGPFRR